MAPITDFPALPMYFVNFDHASLFPQINSQNLGLMAAGISRHPDDLFPAAPLIPLDYKKASIGDPGGVSVRVQHANPSIASRTFYLHLPPRISRAETLVAQVTFDLPDAFTETTPPTIPPTEVPSNSKWAVGLNFKDGTQDDLASDTINIGPTCHFLGNGQPVLGFATSTDPPPPISSYANYRTQRTSFQLTVRMIRTLKTGFGDASLQVGTAVQYANLDTQPPHNNFIGNGITQVGIAIVNVLPKETIVRARLQSFKLWMNP
jgi:hypothetical protein